MESTNFDLNTSLDEMNKAAYDAQVIIEKQIDQMKSEYADANQFEEVKHFYMSKLEQALLDYVANDEENKTTIYNHNRILFGQIRQLLSGHKPKHGKQIYNFLNDLYMEIYDEMRRIFDIFSEILRKSWSNDWSNTVNYALDGIRTKVVNGFIDFKDKIRSKTDEDYNPQGPNTLVHYTTGLRYSQLITSNFAKNKLFQMHGINGPITIKQDYNSKLSDAILYQVFHETCNTLRQEMRICFHEFNNPNGCSNPQIETANGIVRCKGQNDTYYDHNPSCFQIAIDNMCALLEFMKRGTDLHDLDICFGDDGNSQCMFHDNLFVNRTVDCERWHLSDANKFIQDLQIRENQQMYSVCCDLYYSHCKEMGVGICYRKVFPLKEQLKYDVFERIEHAYIISCILQYAQKRSYRKDNYPTNQKYYLDIKEEIFEKWDMKLKMSRPTAKKREQYLKVLTTYLEDFDNYQYILFSVNYCKTMLNNGKWDAADLINKKLKDVGDVIYDDILRRSKKHWDEIKLRAEHRHSRKDFLKPSAKDNQ